MAEQFRGRRIHFVGIGGSGLSAIARVLLEEGAIVSGSDLVLSPAARALAQAGARVFEGHRADQIAGAEWIVVSSAVPPTNVEVQAARRAGIPVLKRPQFLRWMMEGRTGIAVAGTHGKTTTTAMIVSVLLAAGRDPTFIVGGIVRGWGTNAHAGKEPLMVIEADEYDRTFLSLTPTIAVITNVEHDHPDCYPTFADFRRAFEEFAALVPRDGLLVVCADDETAREIGRQRVAEGGHVMTFGFGGDAEWRVEEARPNFAGGVDFLASHKGAVVGLMRLRVPGAHNATNALAALAVANFLGIPSDVARDALMEFRGVERRFEVKGEARGVAVVDDYAHHPTEIRATLKAARARFPQRRLWAVWQPHTYSRTQALLGEFAQAFRLADHVIVLPIYAAREADTLGLDHRQVAAHLQAPDVRSAASLQDAVALLEAEVQPGDIVLTLSAGDGNKVGEWLLDALQGAPDRGDGESNSRTERHRSGKTAAAGWESPRSVREAHGRFDA